MENDPMSSSSLSSSRGGVGGRRRRRADEGDDYPASRSRSSGGISSSSSSGSLLPRLLEACARHRRRHDREADDENENNDDGGASAGGGSSSSWCRDELSRMEGAVAPRRSTNRDGYSRVVARVRVRRRRRRGIGGVGDDYDEEEEEEEEELKRRSLTRKAGGVKHDSDEKGREDDNGRDDDDDDDDDDDVVHLCALYRAISSRSFCPRARRVLLLASVPSEEYDDGGDGDARDDDGDVGIALGILPRISALLGFASADPGGAAFSSPRDAAAPAMIADDNRRRSSLSDVIGATIASLLSLLRTDDARFAACRDLLDLSDDLGVLDDDGALFDPTTKDDDDGDDDDDDDDDDGHRGRDGTDEGDAGGGGSRTTANGRVAGGEIRVEVFAGVATLVMTRRRRIRRGQRGSEGNDDCDGDPSSSPPSSSSSSYDRLWVRVPSRRSLLSVRLAAWTALRAFAPSVLTTTVTTTSSLVGGGGGGGRTGVGGEVGDHDGRLLSRGTTTTATTTIIPPSPTSARLRRELVDALLSSARTTAMFSPVRRRHSSSTSWTYSPDTIAVHSLLELRTEIAISDLLASVSDSTRECCGVSCDVARRVDLASMAAEAARCRLTSGAEGEGDGVGFFGTSASTGGRADGVDDGDGRRVPRGRSLYRTLNSARSSALSDFVASAILLPEYSSAPTTIAHDVWSEALPLLADCIPVIPPESECLGGVVMRTIHFILLSSSAGGSGSFEFLDAPPPSFVENFANRCLARGYLPCLFRLMKGSEPISGPAISIVVALLLESSPGGALTAAIDLVETACSYAIVASESRLGRDDGGEAATAEDENAADSTTTVRSGIKRRRLERLEEGDEWGPRPGASSMESAFAHAVSDALCDAQRIAARRARVDEGRIPIVGGPDMISLVVDTDARMLKGVAGVLRLLLSLRSRTTTTDGSETGPWRRTDEAISRLFRSVQFVSENLVRQRSEGMLVHVEPKVLRSALSSILAVGFHACRELRESASIDYLSAREAISRCAITTLQTLDLDRAYEVKDDECSRMMTRANTRGLCDGVCCRLASMVGAIARPSSDICLCGLIRESSGHLADEFYVEDILPLSCR